MGQTCRSSSSTSIAQIRQFSLRNTYSQPNLKLKSNPEQHIQRILQTLICGHQIKPEHELLAIYLCKQQNREFVDTNFTHLQTIADAEKNSLHKLYDFKKRNIQKVYQNRQTSITIFDQKQLQLSYLTSVFYALCLMPELKHRIFVTKDINQYNAYIVRLFCNGKQIDVILDQTVPIQRQSNFIKYLSGRNMEQIWPFLLQKAWCKQIGSYDRAKGLSPEDCFQQITGIPAYSHAFFTNSPAQNFQMIRQAKKKGYWAILIAKINEQVLDNNQGLKSRQVFFVQSIFQDKRLLRIISPYLNYNIKNYSFGKYSNYSNNGNSSVPEGCILLTQDQILNNFDYFTIGMCVPGYVPISYPIKCQKNKQFIYQLYILQQASINIRFNQFYKQYLKQQQKLVYEYSPVMLQLYDENLNIMKNCEGKVQNLIGLRSSYISYQDFVNLPPGKYYLRILVTWENQAQLNQGNIVVYAPKNSIQLNKYMDQNLDLFSKLISYPLESSRKVINNHEQQLRVRYVQKVHGYLLGMENLSKTPSTLKVILKGSKNIRINHYEIVDNSLVIKLDGLMERVLQILPKNPKQEYHLTSFDVIKAED